MNSSKKKSKLTTVDLSNYLARNFDIKKWILLLVSFTFIGIFYQKTLNPLLENRTKIIQEAYYINELQNTILETITLSQIQGIQHFDTLNAQAQSLEKVLTQLSENPGILSSQELTNATNRLLQTAIKQRNYIESFKTGHSVVQNSLNYLPTVFKTCFQQVNDIDSPFHSEEALTLIQDTLLLVLTINQKDKKHSTFDLKRNIEKIKESKLDSICTSFVTHNKVLIEYLPKVQKIHDNLQDLKFDQDIHDFYLTLEKLSSETVNKNKTYYLILSLFALILIFYIALTLNSLYRTNKKLSLTLSELSEQQGLFSTLIKVNSAIIDINDQNLLFQKICDIAVQEANLDCCWIGTLHENGDITPIATAGMDKEAIMQLTPKLGPKDLKETATTSEEFSSKHPVITNDFQTRMLKSPWAKQVQEWGIQSSATLPIFVGKEIIGFLVTYTRKTNFFTPKVNILLEQLADEIGIAVQKIRLEQAQISHQQDLAVAAIAFESHEAILITDANKHIIRVNDAFTKLTGYSIEETLGKTPGLIKSGLHDKKFYTKLWESIEKSGKWQGEVWNRKKDGTLYPSWQSISTLYNEDGSVSHYVSHSMDLTRDKESQREIHYLNNHDTLTKLPNRTLLIDRIEQQLGQHLPNYNFLFLININRFKVFNESLGHTAGDNLLIQASQRLKNCQFEDIYNITVARVGNDEFCLLCLTEYEELEEATLEAGHIGSRIQNALSKEFTIQNNTVVIDTSIGVSLFKPAKASVIHQTPETLLQEANTALHRAKQTSSTSIQFFEAFMQEQAQQRLSLETELRTALTNKEFILHYQPQKSLKTGKTIGLEALIRWQKSEQELVPPIQFIPVLEETGLIKPVGTWIIEEALTQTKILHKLDPNLTVSVNLSAIQFNDDNLVDKVKDIIKKINFPPSQLEVEITESLLMTDIKQTLIKLNQLAEIGIKIAIDDFGTGYSSLTYLKRFPINRLKIDKSFIDDITNKNDADSAIVKATIQMAHALNIDTIAEGVEEIAQLEVLKSLECDEIQGYYYSKPLSFNHLVSFIKENHDSY